MEANAVQQRAISSPYFQGAGGWVSIIAAQQRNAIMVYDHAIMRLACNSINAYGVGI